MKNNNKESVYRMRKIMELLMDANVINVNDFVKGLSPLHIVLSPIF